MKIYVATSWRNEQQPAVVQVLRAAGHEVYDFRNPRPGAKGFGWSQIDPAWQSWSAAAFRDALEHPVAAAGFAIDMHALETCDACVLVLPCGRSAHLELGQAAGAGKKTIVLLADGCEPELMYGMCHRLCLTLEEVVEALAVFQGVMARPPAMDMYEVDDGEESYICAARDHAEALTLASVESDSADEVTVKKLNMGELAGIEITDEDGGKSTYAQELMGAEQDGRGRLIASTVWP